MRLLIDFARGVLFGLGLVVCGLVNPAKVLAFLDLAGAWDPSLALTMAAAVAGTALGYRLAFRNARPWLDARFQLPLATAIDRPLVAGAALFGIGWGLSGYCPGPAFAAVALGNRGTFIFIVAMLLGMAVARWLHVLPPRSAGSSDSAPATPQA